jgi:hypothetical protein
MQYRQCEGFQDGTSVQEISQGKIVINWGKGPWCRYKTNLQSLEVQKFGRQNWCMKILTSRIYIKSFKIWHNPWKLGTSIMNKVRLKGTQYIQVLHLQ